jgi:hypothetical protein
MARRDDVAGRREELIAACFIFPGTFRCPQCPMTRNRYERNRMKLCLGLAAIIVCAATMSLALAADPPAADEATIKKLVADLGNKDAAVRDAAQKRLGEIGAPAWPALQEALKSTDPEVRTRATAALNARAEVTVKDLGPVPTFNTQLLISPNGEHAAYQKVLPNGKQVLVFDGKEGPDGSTVVFDCASLANDGSMACLTQKAGVTSVTRVGQEDKATALAGNGLPQVLLSADGSHLAYVITRKDGQQTMVCDGKEGPAYPRIDLYPAFFSPNGQTLAYWATGDAGQVWVVGGKPLGGGHFIAQGVFSPDGKRFAFEAEAGDKRQVICDGQASEAYAAFLRIGFTADSRKLAYVAWKDAPAAGGKGSAIIVVDGKEVTTIKDGSGVLGGRATLVLSPDGKHIAYSLAHELKWNLVVDDKPLPQVYDADNVMHFMAPPRKAAESS